MKQNTTRDGELLYTYKGGFANGKRTGVGRVVEKRMGGILGLYDSFTYTGKVYNDILEDTKGKGVYQNQGIEYTYIGGYKNNKKNGFGRETFSEKDIEQKEG